MDITKMNLEKIVQRLNEVKEEEVMEEVINFIEVVPQFQGSQS